jgi:protein-tyrosine phosphatase
LKAAPCISSILVVCDGNYCRSPLAKALLQAAVGPGKRVESAGLTALEGYSPHPLVQQLAAEHGLDLSSDRGRQLTVPVALSADLILVMEERQKVDCGRLAPSARGRLFLLGHWRPADQREIPDPVQRGAEAIRRSFEQISQAVSDWVPHLVQG